MKRFSFLQLGFILTAFAQAITLVAQDAPATPGASGPTPEERKLLAADTRPTAATTPGEKATDPAPFTLEIRDGYIYEKGQRGGDGSIGAIVEYLKKSNHDFSLVLGPGAEKAHVENLILHLPQFDIRIISQALYSCATPDLRMDALDGGIISLALHDLPEERQVEIYNLSTYLNPNGNADKKTIDDKLATVTDTIRQTVYDLDKAAMGDMTFQFHEGTNLLVVTGTNRAVNVADKVVNALNQSDSVNIFSNVPDSKTGDIDFRNLSRDDALAVDVTKLSAEKLDAEIIDLQNRLNRENSFTVIQSIKQKLDDAQKRLTALTWANAPATDSAKK
ncbi:MAG TPA: hypothetical protein VK737_05855 [Opitutales bacterium]|jgi:hypothetical protein|nr:hypothetical protein [Opitutales bacterium]